MKSSAPLARRLGLGDAVVIGVGSMVGAGVFAVFAPASAAAGAGLLIGLAIAAIVAFCNATSSAQLAARYPTSGGTYIYGREQLGQWPGFLAGWSFVIGKTASCAAMALTFATYTAPDGYTKPVAVAAIIALTAVNYFGVTRTAGLTRILVTIVLVILAGTVVLALTGPRASGGIDPAMLTDAGWYAILQSAGLLFFAFAGYARIATMGEEVIHPERTIPRAIVTALGIALGVYVVVAVTVLLVLGPDRLATSTAPLVDVVTAAGQAWATPVVRVADRRRRAHVVGDGPARGSAVVPDRCAPEILGATPRRDHARCRRQHLDRHHRSPRRHRVLVLRCAAVLPDRQRQRVHPGVRSTPLPESISAARGTWLPDAGCDIACHLDRCRNRSADRRCRLPCSSNPTTPRVVM